jgi:glycosyltransferase involved in cell wall biosynthesis
MSLPEEPRVSVLISTHNRADILAITLDRLRLQQVLFPWEILVVDNACTDSTASLLETEATQGQLPLRILHEPRRGKSRAINLALEHAQGSLVVFTDDDVRPGTKWLAEYDRAFCKFADAGVFCGPILPIFPENTPGWLRRHIYCAESYGHFAPPIDEGYLPPPWLPFGSNFAARSNVLQGMKMREDLGPSAEADLMSEDTEFVKRLRLRSEEFVYVPTAAIGHYIRKEQIDFGWLFERAFRLGRSLMIESCVIDMTASVNHFTEGEAGYFEVGMMLNYYYGQMYQLCLFGDYRKAQMLEEAIQSLPWSGEPSHLARSAVDWLVQDPSRIPTGARDKFLSFALPA